MKNNKLFALKVIIGSSLLLSLLFYIDVSIVCQNIYELGLFKVLMIFLVSLLLVLVQALRLHVLIVHYIKNYLTTLKLSLIGQFFSNFLPGGISGDIYKIFLLKRYDISLMGATSLIALDRVMGLIWIVFFGCYSLFFFSSEQFNLNISLKLLYLTLLIIIFLFVVFYILYKNSFYLQTKILSIINKIKYDLILISRTQKYLFLITSFFTYLLRVFKFYVIILMFNQSVNFYDLFFVVFFTQIVGIFPLSVGGLGVLEASLVYGLSLFGVSNEVAFSIALINRISMWFFSILGGIFWISIKKHQ